MYINKSENLHACGRKNCVAVITELRKLARKSVLTLHVEPRRPVFEFLTSLLVNFFQKSIFGLQCSRDIPVLSVSFYLHSAIN